VGQVINALKIGFEGDGKTPIDPEQAAGLKITTIQTLGELNIHEEVNVAAGYAGAMRRIGKVPIDDFLTESYMHTLHAKCFGDVWLWAGTQRRVETSIGIAPERISNELRQWLENLRFQSTLDNCNHDEIAAELHYRIVRIHPYPNGNGRTSRIMAELYLKKVGRPIFSWGDSLGTQRRSAYISALREADAGRRGPLQAFVRS
jgi:Fic-DOC domain mobile mystery protein B